MLEPVEIDIIMRQNVSDEAGKAAKEVKGLSATVTKESDSMREVLDKVGHTVEKSMSTPADKTKELREQLEIQKKVLSELEAQYAKAKADFDKVNVSGMNIEEWRNAKAIFQEVRAELDAEKQGLIELEKQYEAHISTIDRQSKAHERSVAQKRSEEEKREKQAAAEEKRHQKEIEQKRKQEELESRTIRRMRMIREEMTQLVMAGKQETARYQELQKELENVGTAYRLVQQEQKHLTTAGSDLTGLASGITALSGAFSAFQGIASMFVTDNDRLAKIQTKLQAAMAITIGLQQVSNTLHQTSAFRINTVTKVTSMWTTANTRLAVALGISNVAAKALMGTLTLGLSVAIGFVIDAINKYITRQQKAAEEQKKFSESVIASSSEVLSSFERLRKTYDKLGNTLEDKEKFIHQNRDELNKLGVAINSVNDADNLFIHNADAFKEAMMYRARSVAAMEIAAEKYKEYLTKMDAADKREKKASWWDKLSSSNDFFSRDGRNVLLNKRAVAAADKQRAEAEKLNKEADKFIDSYLLYTDEYREKLQASNIRSLDNIEKDTKAWWEAYQKQQDDQLSRFKSSEIGSDEWLKIKAERDKAAKMLEKWNEKKSTKEENKEAQRQLNAEQKLQETRRTLLSEALKEQNDMLQKSIDLMDDSFAKRYEQVELNYAKELQAIREYEDKKAKEQQEYAKQQYISQHGSEIGFDFNKTNFDVLPEGLRPEDIKARVDEMTTAALEAWGNARLLIIRDEVEMMRQQELAFASEMDRELSDLNKNYADQIRAAKGNDRLVRMLIENREKEANAIRTKYAIQNLAFESEIAQRRMQILRKPYMFEADRREDELLHLRTFTEQKIELLKNQYNEIPTDELAQEIQLATLELEEFNRELEQIPVDRLQEGLGHFKSIAGSLAGLGGEAGEFFSTLSGQIDTINLAMDESASKGDKISAAISGIVNLVMLVTTSYQARKQAEKEFYRNAIAMAHEYSLALNEQLRLQSELAGSGFISNYAGRLKDGYNALTDAAMNYREAIAKLADGKAKIDLRNSVDWGKVGKGAAIGAATGAAIGSFAGPIGTAIGGVIGAVGGFFVGLFGGKKKKNVNSGLLEVFPELVDAAGNLNKELAKTLINTDQVDDNTKQMLQNALDWADAVEAANEQIKEIVEELAGDLGGDMKEAILAAWKAGEAGPERMFAAANRSLEGFVDNLLYSLLFSDIFDEFGKRLAESLNPDSGDGDILDDFDWLMQQMDERDDAYIAMLDAFKKRAAERGYDLWMPDEEPEEERKGLSKGIQTASQDSMDEWNAGMYSLRITANNIENLSRERQDVLRSMLLIVGQIKEDTAFCRLLEPILNRLDDIQKRGVKMR